MDYKPLAIDLPTFDTSHLAQPWTTPPAVGQQSLDADQKLYRRPKGRTYDDQHAITAAREAYAMVRLPDPGEDLHIWTAARYGSWAVCCALLDRLAPAVADELLIATLSFSKSNASNIMSRLDNGTIKQFGLVTSHYFRASNREIYDTLVPYLAEHNHPVVAIRNHAKVITIKTSDGGYWTIQGSANLRSNQNIEQIIITNDQPTHDFHAGVILSILNKGSAAEIVAK
jgi:hypothetical protein